MISNNIVYRPNIVFLGAKATMNRNKPIAEVVDKHLQGDNQGNRISAAIAGRQAMVDFDRKRRALVEAERVFRYLLTCSVISISNSV